MQLEEKNPINNNGIEYGYYIRNEQVKSAKGDEYSRYEIILYTTNKSGCTKIYADRVSPEAGESANTVANFNCSNANGKRLTAKSSTIKARDFFVNVKVFENGKEVIRSVKAGYIFRNGETINSRIIVLVNKDVRPNIQCMVNNLPEL